MYHKNYAGDEYVLDHVRMKANLYFNVTHLLYCFLVLTPISTHTHSSLEPFQNGTNYRRMSDLNHMWPLFVLPS